MTKKKDFAASETKSSKRLENKWKVQQQREKFGRTEEDEREFDIQSACLVSVVATVRLFFRFQSFISLLLFLYMASATCRPSNKIAFGLFLFDSILSFHFCFCFSACLFLFFYFIHSILSPLRLNHLPLCSSCFSLFVQFLNDLFVSGFLLQL